MIILETKRLRLRMFTREDARAMEAVFCDAEVMRYSDGCMTPMQVPGALETIIDHDYPAHGFGMWAAVEKSSGDVVGYCGLAREPGRCAGDEGELGYRLARAFWGRGYALESAQAVCRYGIQKLGLRRIVATIDPHNQASIRLADRLGMRREGEIVFPGYDYPDLFYVLD